MSLTLELSPELEAQVRDDAQQRGMAPDALVAEQLSSYYEVRGYDAVRREAKARLRGRLKGKGPTVDDFLAERSAEGRKEDGL